MLGIYNNLFEQIIKFHCVGLEILVNSFQKEGVYQVNWQPVGLPSGTYFYRLQAGKFSKTMKLILQK